MFGFQKMQGKGKKILWKVIFLSLGDMKSMMEKKYIKENTKEKIVIFSSYFFIDLYQMLEDVILYNWIPIIIIIIIIA